MIKINFFGTNEFAKTILEGLIKSSDFEIATVFTMPDRPVGRKQVLQKSPVKILAEENGLKIEQPENLKNYSLLSAPYSLNIVCDYGIIIPKEILETPENGSINIHPSLLPLYRGASPIQSVLINGEKETGISIMLMDEKMDHGPVLAQKTFDINPNDTYNELHSKLALEAQILLNKTILKWVDNEIKPMEQSHTEATFCKEFKKEDGKINWNASALEIYNQYRGMINWPGVFTTLNGKRLKLIEIDILRDITTNDDEENLRDPCLPDRQASTPVGMTTVQENKIFVSCGDGNLIEILELQLEGKTQMNAKTFLNGNKDLDRTFLSS